MLISIDHGNKQIKTIHNEPFVSGLQQSITKPFYPDILKYQGSYYTHSEQRIPYRKDKTEDDRFFVLSLFAIANEIEALSCYSRDLIRIQLTVGLPPSHYGSMHKAFTQYFQRREVTIFEYRDKPYSIHIDDVVCFPQAYAAAVTMIQVLIDCPKVMILDIGGFTVLNLPMRYGKADLSNCNTLENGVILLYNKIRSKVNAEWDILLDESDIDAILKGKTSGFKTEWIQMVEYQAQEFVNDLFSTLRERMVDLRTGKTVFVGGGSILLRKQIEASGKVDDILFIEDINANAKGYEFLYQLETAGR